MEKWAGKVAIVTGASAGIGAAIAESLVENGLKVVGVARRVQIIEENAKKLSAKKGQLYAFKTDLTKEEDILRLFEWTSKNLGPVHILVNNAAISADTPLINGETELWKSIFDLNVMGLSIATREAVKIMKENKIDGHIVNINSMMGLQVPNVPNMSMYPASKFALTALTETLRQELESFGLRIKITTVRPGLVDTEATTLTKHWSVERQDYLRKMRQLGKILKPRDIADGVVYALSTPENVQVFDLTIRPI